MFQITFAETLQQRNFTPFLRPRSITLVSGSPSAVVRT